MTTVADLIVGLLRDAGVRFLFGMPGGGSNLDLLDAAGRDVRIDPGSYEETLKAVRG